MAWQTKLRSNWLADPEDIDTTPLRARTSICFATNRRLRCRWLSSKGRCLLIWRRCVDSLQDRLNFRDATLSRKDCSWVAVILRYRKSETEASLSSRRAEFVTKILDSRS
jgi:hypothetical protein